MRAEGQVAGVEYIGARVKRLRIERKLSPRHPR
jgi:hypothetical protein